MLGLVGFDSQLLAIVRDVELLGIVRPRLLPGWRSHQACACGHRRHRRVDRAVGQRIQAQPDRARFSMSVSPRERSIEARRQVRLMALQRALRRFAHVTACGSSVLLVTQPGNLSE